MPDREKVINGLKETMKLLAVTNSMFKYGFPDINSDIYDNSMIAISNAIALLKAQEPVKVKIEQDTYPDETPKGLALYYCGNCGDDIADGQKFCANCGRPVKWND